MQAIGKAAPTEDFATIAASMSGIDFRVALRDGSLPLPQFAATTKIQMVSRERGRVVFEGTPAEQFYHALGTVRGVWIATLLDTAMACAIQSRLPPGQTYTTLELKTNFARPVLATTGTLRCAGQVHSLGSRITGSGEKILDNEGNHGSETRLIIGKLTASRT